MRTQLIIILSLLNVCLVPAQERDTRVRTYITPTRIVWQQDSDHITNCNFLLNQGDGQAYWGAYYDYESIDTGLQRENGQSRHILPTIFYRWGSSSYSA